ncbi:MAG: hypothetical protein CVU91_10315 [Firmicutes bacterium HGW-Firmicutes-16]|nr:MAG: hypothetical protein CVU91_10315 [Firmicutes bacterium HGW-Firmicutes-16]
MFNRLREIMAGRNGFDRLSITFIVLAFVLYTLAFLSPVIAVIALGIAAYAIWRAFSKNLAKRREENYRFTRISGDTKDSFTQWKFRRQQKKQYRFITCPDCKSKLRLPRGKGKISITCPKCGLKFSGKT